MKYFFGFLVAILLIITVIVLIFSGGNSKPKVPMTSRTLYSYANTDAEVALTIDGPIVSEETHDVVRITVNQNKVTYTQFKGYTDEVRNIKIYDNNQNSFAVFLRALDYLKFTSGNPDKALRDERGHCPTGTRYVFDLNQNHDNLEHYWSTSCGSPKTFLGNAGTTIDLFQAQVPDYNDLTTDLNLQ